MENNKKVKGSGTDYGQATIDALRGAKFDEDIKEVKGSVTDYGKIMVKALSRKFPKPNDTMSYLIKKWLGKKVVSDDVKKELENHLKYSKQDPKPLMGLYEKLLKEEEEKS